jgi:copper chaperone
MNTYIFKTNLQCANCRAKVQPLLDKSDEVLDWQLNLEHPERLLTVKSPSPNPEDISKLVARAGFQAQLQEQAQ